MKNDLTIIRLNPEKHSKEIEMFNRFRKNNLLDNANLNRVWTSSKIMNVF